MWRNVSQASAHPSLMAHFFQSDVSASALTPIGRAFFLIIAQTCLGKKMHLRPGVWVSSVSHFSIGRWICCRWTGEACVNAEVGRSHRRQQRCQLCKHSQLRFHVVAHILILACEGRIRACVFLLCVVCWGNHRASQMLARLVSNI